MATEPSRDVARVGSGGGLLYLGTLVQLGAQWAFALVLARGVGAEALGLFTLGFAAVQGLSLMAINGLDVGLVRFVSPAVRCGDQARVKSMLWAAIATALIPAGALSCGLFLVLPRYLEQTTTLSGVAAAARLFAPAVPLQVALTVLTSFALANGNPLAKVLAERVIGPVLQVFFVFALVSRGMGLTGAVLAYSMGLVAGVGVAAFFVIGMYPGGSVPLALRNASKTLYGFSYRQGLAAVTTFVLTNGVLFVLAHYTYAGEVGLYTAARRFSMLGLLFIQAFGEAFAPLAARENSLTSLQASFETVTRWILALSAPVLIVMLAFPGIWMGIMGPEFVRGAPVLVVMAAAQLVGVLTGPAGVVLAVRDRPGLNLLNNTLAWGTQLLLSLVLVPKAGALGGAWAYLVAVVVIKALEAAECGLLLHLVPLGRASLRPLIVLAAVAIPFEGLALMAPWSLQAAVGLSAGFLGAYAVLMWYVGVRGPDEEIIRSLVPSMRKSTAGR